MEIRYSTNPMDVKFYDTDNLRKTFLISNLFEQNKLKLVYSYIDRIIVGGAYPKDSLRLNKFNGMGTAFFLENREMGIINIGNTGFVIVDGETIELNNRDGLYIGKGKKEIIFKSRNSESPAKFYFNSTLAHKTYPTVKIDGSKVIPEEQGSIEKSNKRKIYKYIYPTMCQSCQLVMGITVLEPNNLWNTMPSHLHKKRMETYFYFNMPEDSIAFHIMGEPKETRHIVVKNHEAVISPSWSIHSAVGTSNYDIIWSMAGENQDFADVTPIKTIELL